MLGLVLGLRKLQKEGTNELPKDGFDWITLLKVIFQGPKGLKKVKFGCFCYFLPIYSKADRITFLCILLLWDDIDQLSRDGFHWIIQKVIFKVGKVRFSPFSHNYWYYSIVMKCCPNLLHHVAFLLWNQSCPKIWKLWNHSKGHFQGQKGPIWTFVIYFS